jgi:hypothetical protein
MIGLTKPVNGHFIELTDLDNQGKILNFDWENDNLMYNPETDRWEWAQMSTDYILPFSPYSGSYRDITEAELNKKYPTALKALEKPVDESVPCHWNHVAPDEIDPYGSFPR